MLVFRPLSEDDLRTLGRGGELPVHVAFGATPEFLSAFGLEDPHDEDAERTLLYLAALTALLRSGRRLVAVAEVDARGRGNEFGVVSDGQLCLAQVSALFAEAPESERLAQATRAALAQVPVEDAWEHPAHEVLLAEADLLWYGPEEWAVLTGDLEQG